MPIFLGSTRSKGKLAQARAIATDVARVGGHPDFRQLRPSPLLLLDKLGYAELRPRNGLEERVLLRVDVPIPFGVRSKGQERMRRPDLRRDDLRF